MKLIDMMCNQPQRLVAALAPVRAALHASPPVSRWGLGYVQGGDVLLVRTPRASTTPIDLATPLSEIKTDCMIAQAVRGGSLGGTDNTPPFRFRRWMYAQTGMLEVTQELPELAPRLLEQIPEYLRRNIKGRTCSELIFHLFLSMLHDEGNIDDPNLPTVATRRALAATLRVVSVELEKLGRTGDTAVVFGNVALSNGRSMVVAHPDPLSEPLRLRRLWVTNERGEPERGPDAFRGVLFVGGGEAESSASHELGFEDVFAHHSVLVSRDLQVTLADLAP